LYTTWSSVEAGFVGKQNENIMVEANTAENCVKQLREYKVAEGRFGLDWDSMGKKSS